MNDELSQKLKAANKWRSAYNPLRGLTISRAVQLLEAGERGEYADLQWTYRLIEKRWATLKALRKRRLSALGALDWSIKTADDSPEAKAQAETLRVAYSQIKNLKRAIRFLGLASFRGYSHLEKIHRNASFAEPIIELRIVDQWFWCRDGVYGAWEYNATARAVSRGTPIDPARFIIRDVEDPINEIGIISFLRCSLSQKDWDAFIETYGIPPIFLKLPPTADKTKQEEYQAMADAIIGDMRGTIPDGADIKTVDVGSRGTNPFNEHLRYQDEQLVLAGTGGKLTMLSEATGIGGGATGAHQSTFDEIAQDEAADISELLQEQFDAEVLANAHPGQPVLAYFELAAQSEEDLGQLADRAVKLKQAGFDLDPAELSEKFGLKLTRSIAPAPFAPGGVALNRAAGVAAVLNRESTALDPKFRDTALTMAGKAFRANRSPVATRIQEVLALPDDKYESGLQALLEELRGPLAKEVLASPQGTKALIDAFGTAVVAGAAEAASKRPTES